MNTSEALYSLIEEGKIRGFSTPPKCVTTVISRVYIFDAENTVLKIYKRDNEWWNKDMNDLSAGVPRIDFIRRDFAFNHFLDPGIYLELKTLSEENGEAVLVDAKPEDDELVVVMKKVDASQTMSKMLSEQSLSITDYENIGRDLANKKMALPKDFLPHVSENWYEQMVRRLEDLKGWVTSEPDFSPILTKKGLSTMQKILEANKEKFTLMKNEDLAVCIDCNTENLLFIDGKLAFIDAYPPKDEWRGGAFDHDIFRTGSDVYALGGKDAYDAYLTGVYSVAEHKLDKELHTFYLLYGAMIMGPYLYMLGKKDTKFLPAAEKYSKFIEEFLVTNYHVI
jgi:aminoglycoside phosphotransferase family enzyme